MGAENLGKGKKKKGFLSKAGGALMSALRMPQQVAFRTGSGAAELLQGRPGTALEEFAKGGAELLTAGQIGGDIGFAEATTPLRQREQGLVRKLPTGVAGTADILLDPLLVGGTTRKGVKGVQALSKATGLSPKVLRKGLATGEFNLRKGGQQRALLEEALKTQGLSPLKVERIAKGAARTGGRGAAKTALGESIQQTGRKAGRAIATGPVGRTTSRLTQGVRPAAELTAEVGSELTQSVRAVAARVSAKAASEVDDFVAELSNASAAAGRKLDDDDMPSLYRALEAGEPPLDPALQPLYQTIDRNRHLLDEETVAAGLLGTDMTARAALLGERAADAAGLVAEQQVQVRAALDSAKAAKAVARKTQSEVEKSIGTRTKLSSAEKAARTRANKAVKKADDEIKRLQKELEDQFKPAIREDIEAAGLIKHAPDDIEWSPVHGTVFDQMDEVPKTPDSVQYVAKPVEGGDVIHAAVYIDEAGKTAGAATITLSNIGSDYLRATGKTLKEALDETPEFITELDGPIPLIRPDKREQGIANRLYDQLEEAGLPIDQLSGTTGYTPGGAALVASRRARRAAAAVDTSTSKTRRLQEAAERASVKAEEAKTKADTARTGVSELRKTATQARKDAEKAAEAAKKERGKLTRLKAEARKASAEAEKVRPGVAGVRQNHMLRLLSDEAMQVARRGQGASRRSVQGEIASNLEATMAAASTRMRTQFPDLPVEMLNALKSAYDEGLDLMTVIRNDPDMMGVLRKANRSEAEIADMVESFKPLAEAVPKGAQIYKADPIESVITNFAAKKRALAGKAFIDELMDISGDQLIVRAEDVREGTKSVPADWVDVKIPGVGEFKANKALTSEINRVSRIAGRDKFTEDFDKAMRGWRDFWKAHATVGIVGSIPFAARNFRSNIWLMMTRGQMGPQDIPKRMKEAWKLESKIREIAGQGRVGTKFKGQHAEDVADRGLDAVLRDELTGHEYNMWREMQNRDINRGFIDIEFGQTSADAARGVRGDRPQVAGSLVGQVLSPRGRLIQGGRDINQAAEQNARMALFMHVYDETGSFDEAEKVVKATLFDYQDLTEFEQKRLKWVAPFYTFMRKNLQAQAEVLGSHPIRVVAPEKLSQLLSEGLDEDAPEYLQDMGARRVHSAIPLLGGQYTMPDRPIAAAAESVDPLVSLLTGGGVKETARSLANIPGGPQIGALTSLAEIGTGSDVFTGGRVKEGPREAVTRLIESQVPSLARVPRVGPVADARQKEGRPPLNELVRMLAGLSVTPPRD